MEEVNKCLVCSKPATQSCGKCMSVRYCGENHQHLDWKKHQPTCRPFKIFRDEVYGRYAVATKSINKGEVITKAMPLVSVPSGTLGNLPLRVCVGCTGLFNPGDTCLCENCKWPLCSKKCASNPVHIPECRHIKKLGKLVHGTGLIYDQSVKFLLTLRCIYQKKLDPDTWDKIINLETNYGNNERSGYNRNLELISKDFYKGLNLKNYFRESDVYKVMAVISANSCQYNVNAVVHRAVYEGGYLFEHSCNPNCERFYNENGLLRTVASKPIKKGDHLTLCYIDSHLTTPQRQEKLQHYQMCYSVVCQCDRCTDVTEFGTYFSGIGCLKGNCGGILLPESFLDSELDWNCNKCENKVAAYTVSKLYKSVETAFQKANTSDDFVHLLNYYHKTLPQNNSYMLKAKLETVFRTRQCDEFSDDKLLFRIYICREVADFLPQLVSGEKKRRMEVLFHLQRLLGEMSSRKGKAEGFTPSELHNVLQQRKACLNEILDAKYDNGLMYDIAKEQLEKVTDTLTKLENLK